jgi:hypothetical protein
LKRQVVKLYDADSTPKKQRNRLFPDHNLSEGNQEECKMKRGSKNIWQANVMKQEQQGHVNRLQE